MSASLPCLPDLGPAPGFTLACHEAGCGHLECRRAARAHERLTERRDATGTRRRLQALAFMGHSTGMLAAALDVPSHIVRRAQDGTSVRVTATLADAVSALYDRLWDVRGASHHAVVTMAERRGWVPPLAWDDDNEAGHGIDDPAAVPADWKPRGGRRPLADRIENITEVLAQGNTPQQAAWRLGTTRGVLQKLQSRARLAVTA